MILLETTWRDDVCRDDDRLHFRFNQAALSGSETPQSLGMAHGAVISVTERPSKDQETKFVETRALTDDELLTDEFADELIRLISERKVTDDGHLDGNLRKLHQKPPTRQEILGALRKWLSKNVHCTQGGQRLQGAAGAS
jgi:hypothetical protein